MLLEHFGILLAVLQSITTIIIAGMIPWAFMMERRLAKIEGILSSMEERREEHNQLEARVRELEIQIARSCEGDQHGN